MTEVGNHPHVYGEYQIPDKTHKVKDRITPMCMGSTKIWGVTSNRLKNHPHVYGEYSKNYLIYRHS